MTTLPVHLRGWGPAALGYHLYLPTLEDSAGKENQGLNLNVEEQMALGECNLDL